MQRNPLNNPEISTVSPRVPYVYGGLRKQNVLRSDWKNVGIPPPLPVNEVRMSQHASMQLSWYGELTNYTPNGSFQFQITSRRTTLTSLVACSVRLPA